MIAITDTLSIADDEIQLDFVQSSGPGGQNVNKVASAAQLRFDTNSASLPDEVRSRLLRIAKNRISSDGILLIEAKRYRSQEQNRLDAIQRLIALLRQATEKPKVRRRTKPTQASIEKRLETKRRRSETKQRRRMDLE